MRALDAGLRSVGTEMCISDGRCSLVGAEAGCSRDLAGSDGCSLVEAGCSRGGAGSAVSFLVGAAAGSLVGAAVGSR